MASAPSAAALSAVLRCRGTIWSRNPPTKRPSSGLTGGARSGSPAERSRSKVPEQRVAVGRGLVVVYDGKVSRKKDTREINYFSSPKLLRHLTQGPLTSNVPAFDTCSTIQREACAARACKIISLRGFPVGVLRVSITSPRCAEETGQYPVFIPTHWSTLKISCCSLTAWVSEVMVVWRSSSLNDATQQDETITGDVTLPTYGQTHSTRSLTSSKDVSGCGRRTTEDRPD